MMRRSPSDDVAAQSMRAASEFVPFGRDDDIFSPASRASAVEDLLRDLGSASPPERAVEFAPTDTAELDRFLMDFVYRRKQWAHPKT